MIKKLPQYQMATTRLQMLCAGLTILTTFGLAASSESFESNLSISKNLFLQRAFSANTSREMMMEGHIIKTDFDGFYSFFSATGAYQHSWNNDETDGIGAFPFWSGINSMTVGINGIPGTNPVSNLDAYQFGLGNVTTNGLIKLNPIIYQGGSDFLFYAGASTNDPGLFLKIKAPLGIIKMNPQFTEPVEATAATYPNGALNEANNTTYQPATTMTQALAGLASNDPAISGLYIPLKLGLIDGIQSSGVKFADIELTLGYNFICDEDHLFGLGLRASGPSGNKPDGVHMLQPIFGRGSSWGVGAYLVGGMKLWENHENKYFAVNIMGTVLHLLNSNTIRSYDLTANGPGSKYLLVADYNNNTDATSIQNLINLSTMASQSSFSAEGDASLELQYVSNGWEVDLGYNFWGRTNETLVITEKFPESRYAILGRQLVGTGVGAQPSTLCQPTATINESINPLGGDNATNANGIAVDARIPVNRIAGSSVFDFEAAQQAAASTSKVFTKAAYSWLDSHMSPYLGVLGEFEISTSGNNALNQWSVAILGGLYF